MSQSRLRDLATMLKDAGLDVVESYPKAGRVHVQAAAPNGVTRSFSLSLKPSDARGDLNEQAKIRRFARENTPIPPAVELPPPVVTPKADMTKNTAPEAAQELTPREFYRLCELLKKVDLTTVASLEVAARHMSAELDLKISEQILCEAMEATDTQEPDAWHPLPEPHVIMARELEALMKSLGQEPSPTFRRLLAAL